MKRPQAGKSCATEGEKDESTSLVLKVAKLRKGWEFDEIFRTGERANGELVRILYLRGREPDVKFGCVVGKRQGKAHVRSRGKRILSLSFKTKGFRRSQRRFRKNSKGSWPGKNCSSNETGRNNLNPHVSSFNLAIFRFTLPLLPYVFKLCCCCLRRMGISARNLADVEEAC